MSRSSIAAAVLAVAISGRAASADDAPRRLSLADAVQAALASDAELYVAREDVEIATGRIALARSAFVPKLFGELSGKRSDLAPDSISFPAVETRFGGSLGVSGRISTGLTYSVSAGLTRVDRDDPIATVYDRAITTTVHGELVQPLRRGAFAAARIPIIVAARRRDQSAQLLRARLERTVGAVEVAYWDLVRARSEREARRAAIDLANSQLEDSRKLKRLGTGSDHDIAEAESGVSRRIQDLLRADQEVTEAEGRLIAALGVRIGERGWPANAPIEPTDAPEIVPLAEGVDAYLARARTDRAEVLAARAEIVAELAELELAASQRRAAIDLVVAAGTTGFAGALQSTIATDGIDAGDPRFQSDPAYDGGLGRSLRNTLGRDGYVYLGLRFELPVGGHEAAVKHALQQRAVTRARLTEHQTLARIEAEVRTAYRRVTLAAQLIAAADRTAKLAQVVVDGVRKRFRAGAATSFDVLRASEELTRAQIDVARARADYRASLTRLAAASGSLLADAGVTVRSLGATPR